MQELSPKKKKKKKKMMMVMRDKKCYSLIREKNGLRIISGMTLREIRNVIPPIGEKNGLFIISGMILL